MAGKSPEEAADNFVYFLKETLSCITSQYINAHHQSSNLYKLYYEPYAVVNTGGTKKYAISITQIFRVVPVPNVKDLFKAKTQEYSYRLLEGANAEAEIVAYHWHPLEPGVDYPHLHLKQAGKIHFPTSRVCLEDFIFMLLRDYDVKSKFPRAKWKEILIRNKRAFEKMATWKVQNP